jgi:short-subunit dehydrogenase
MHSTTTTPTCTERGPALITGASSGIGATFARKLAARGHDVILVARRKDRLESLAQDLREELGVGARAVTADLTDQTDLERLEQLIRGRPLEFLVNNAGFGTGGKFANVELPKNRDMLRVHCEAPMRLSHVAVPGMVAAKRGAIINVSSVAGIVRVPGSTMYCSTKAFLNAFSETLSLELQGTGVRVQALCPGFTYTEFHDTPEFSQNFNRSSIPKYLWLSADRVVDMSFRALERDRVICVTGWRYKAMVAVARAGLLRPWMKWVARRMGRQV